MPIAVPPVLADGGRAFGAAWKKFESSVSSAFFRLLRGGGGVASLAAAKHDRQEIRRV